MMASFFFTVCDVSAVIWIKVTWIAENFKESADTLFSLLLSLLLHIYTFVRLIKMSEDLVYEFKKLERCLIIEFHHRKMAHEWWPVKSIDNHFDLLGVEIGWLAMQLSLVALIASLILVYTEKVG